KGQSGSGIHARRRKIRKITAVLDAGLLQLSLCRPRVADSIYSGFQWAQFGERLDKVFLKFAGAFVIAPVPNPIDLAALLVPTRLKAGCVCGFVKRPRTLGVESLQVD